MIVFFDYVLLAGVIQGFFFNGLTFFKRKITKIIFLLNVMVLSLSLNNLQAWLIDVGFSSEIYFLKALLIPWYFLIAPIFYLVVIHYFNIENRFIIKIKHIIGFFLLEVIIRIAVIFVSQQKIFDLDIILIDYYNTLEELLNVIITIVFIVKSIEIIFFKTEYHKFIASYDNIRWLRLLLIFGGITIIFWVFAISLNLQFDIFWANYPLRLCTSFLIYWMAYQGIYKYDLLTERKALRFSLSSNNNQQLEITYNLDYNTEFNEINQYIISNNKFLDTSFSLDKLADELNISTSHLSKIINSCNDYNFSDYINNFRVNKAKKLLSDCDFSNYTIVAIGYESGFNSKSTFYKAFKKFTSITPTVYRQNYNKN